MMTQPNVHKFEFKLAFLDRHELRSSGAALVELNALGADGWHDLVVFLEREIA